MAWLFLALSAAALVWHAATPEAWQFSRAFLPNKAQYFALGIISAVVVSDGREALGAYLAVLGAVLMLCLVQGGVDKLLPPMVWTMCLAAQLASSPRKREPRPAVPVLLAWVPAFAGMTMGVLAAFLQSRPMLWLGAVSYCIYLVNEPVQKVLGVALAVLVDGDAMLFTALWIPAAIVLPLLASWWLHERIEVPAQRHGRGIALATVSAG
jgi:peptidoglycan/LPS O-acetylase OafA/YrhL